MQLVERQQFKCALTGRELTPENATVDHIEPVSLGGANDMTNIWAVCREANAAKNSMPLNLFLQLCRDVAARADLIEILQ